MEARPMASLSPVTTIAGARVGSQGRDTSPFQSDPTALTTTAGARVGFKDFGRIEMRGALVTAVEGERASAETPERKFAVKAGPAFRPGQYIAALLVETPAALTTESGVPLTREREIANGARVR